MYILHCPFTIATNCPRPSYCDENERTCYGIAGEDIVVPCGTQACEDGEDFFVYYNRTNEKILRNSTDCGLKLNLSSYDDGVTITCRSGFDSSVPGFDYRLSVCCKLLLLSMCIWPCSEWKGCHVHAP